MFSTRIMSAINPTVLSPYGTFPGPDAVALAHKAPVLSPYGTLPGRDAVALAHKAPVLSPYGTLLGRDAVALAHKAPVPREMTSVRRMRYLMGTFVSIEVTAEGNARAIDALEAAFREMGRIERVFSKFLPQSVISQLNRSASVSPVTVPCEVFELMERSAHFSRITRGAFDITVNPFMEIWNLSQERALLPSSAEIREAFRQVGFTHIVLEPIERTVFFQRPGMQVDFGAIGKGYALDRAVGILREWGIRKALLNAGGQVFCLDEEPAAIGIRDPRNGEALIAAIWVQDQSIATSANTERFFTIGGEAYGHLIDPRTGYPVQNDILSATLVANSAEAADVLATAVFILGREEGMRLIESMPDVEGLLLTANGTGTKMHASSGLKLAG